AKHFRAGRQSLSVLRQEVSHQRIESRSRRSAQPRRRNELGKRGLQLREMQRAKGWPHAAGSEHAPDQASGEAQTQPAAEREAGQPQVPELEELSGQRLLVGGPEVSVSGIGAHRETASGLMRPWRDIRWRFRRRKNEPQNLTLPPAAS